MGWMFSESIAKSTATDKPTSDIMMYDRSHSASAYAYIAERALLRCVVARPDYLEIDLILATSDPEQVWRRRGGQLGALTRPPPLARPRARHLLRARPRWPAGGRPK